MAKQVSFPCGYDPLDEFMLDVQRKYPKVRVYYKSTSILMKFLYAISLMWIWNRRFFKFHTTIGHKIYLVDGVVDKGQWTDIYGTMRHEMVHVFQRLKWWYLYDISYISPQVFGVIGLLAIWGPWWLVFFLALFAPIPSPWRTKWEMEAYTASLLTYFELHGEIPPWLVERKARNFYTKSYYFMWPFKRAVIRKLTRTSNKIRAGYIKGIYLGIYT